MLKNKTWVIAALFVALAMIFGCTDAGLLDDGSQPKQAEDLVIEGEDIVLEKAGTDSASVTIDGNKVTFDGASMTSTGFYYAFPPEAAEYGEVVVYFKIISIDRGRPGLLVKNSNLSNYTGVLNDQDPQYQLNDEDLNFTVGMEFDTGKKKTSAFTGGRIAFQHQAWNPSGNGNAKYTVEVLKIVFPGDSEPPEVIPLPGYTGAAGKVTFAKVAGVDTVVDADPSITGAFGNIVSAAGAIKMTDGAVLNYKFPTSAVEGTGATAKTIDIDLEKDYDYIDFEFTVSDIELGDKTQLATPGVGASDGRFKVIIRQYGTTDDYGYGFGSYKTWGGNTGGNGDKTERIQTWGAGGKGGVTVAYNYNDRNADGAISMNVKLTKVTFTKGQRYPVAFSDPYTGFSKNVTVLSGNGLRDDMPGKAEMSMLGYTFVGWTTNAAEVFTGYTGAVGSGTAITSAKTLYACWFFGDLPTVTKTGSDAYALICKGASTPYSGKDDATETIDSRTASENIWWIKLADIDSYGPAYNWLIVTLDVTTVAAGVRTNLKAAANAWSPDYTPGSIEGASAQFTPIATGEVVLKLPVSRLTDGFSCQRDGGGFVFSVTSVELKASLD
jgi:hypothetical protein